MIDRRTRFLGAFAIAMIAALLLGAGWAAGEIAMERYVALGFWRNAILVARAHLGASLLAGAVVGMLYGLASAVRKETPADASRTHRIVFATIGAIVVALGAISAIRAPFRLHADPRHVETLLGRAIPIVAVAFGAGHIVGRRALAHRAVRVAGAAAAAIPAIVTLLPTPAFPATLHASRPLNVVVIGIDTLRFDHASLSGSNASGRTLTPNLARLAAKGTRFDAAFSSSCWTMPSFASIVTGRTPQDHGATALFGRLPKRELTLAEILREAGYDTGAVVSHLYVDKDHGFSQGVDAFDQDNSLGPAAITSQAVTDRAIALAHKKGSRPFFLFAHYFDPHYEYRHHESPSFSDWYHGRLRKEGVAFETLERERSDLTPDDLRYLTDLYDEEIAYTDAQIGRLIDALEKDGRLADTMIVVVADHGEEFMERGWIGHSVSLYDDLIHVPLFVLVPGRAADPIPVSRIVETRSVFPTILGELGIAAKIEGLGPPLFAPASGAVPTAYSTVWVTDAPRGSEKNVRMLAARTAGWKFVLDVGRNQYALYDLTADPGESTDVAAAHADVVRDLTIKLKAWWGAGGSRPGERGPGELDPEMREKLKSLGYL